ncbi:MAG: GntR family transcriptional regulator [Burkholderiales bacterium]|nr:GntR family transcriptional regulator [Burkholderiales bacterium]
MKNARWVKLADDLTAEISDGTFPLNSYLPTEMELCAKYNVSRYTVRMALDNLTRLGYIKRWPRLGSKVISLGSKPLSSLTHFPPVSETHKRIVHLTTECIVDRTLALQLECEEQLKLLRFSNVLTDPENEDRPIVWTTVYVNAAYSRLPQIAEPQPLPLLSELIEKEYRERCSQMTQKVTAVALPDEAAKHLLVTPGLPSFRILKHYKSSDNKLLQITESFHPGNGFSLTLSMSNFG